MRYWLDVLKKGRLVEPCPRKDDPRKPAQPLPEPLFAWKGLCQDLFLSNSLWVILLSSMISLICLVTSSPNRESVNLTF